MAMAKSTAVKVRPFIASRAQDVKAFVFCSLGLGPIESDEVEGRAIPVRSDDGRRDLQCIGRT